MHDGCALVFSRLLNLHSGSRRSFTGADCAGRRHYLHLLSAPRGANTRQECVIRAGRNELGRRRSGASRSEPGLPFDVSFQWALSLGNLSLPLMLHDMSTGKTFTETAKLGRSHAPRHSYAFSAAPGNASWQPAEDGKKGRGHLSAGQEKQPRKGLSVEGLEDTIVAALHGMENL